MKHLWKFSFPFFLFIFISSIKEVQAHCPLCTIGAAAAAGGAAYLGVNYIVIGLFIGAFAVSLGWWMANIIKRKFVPLQKFWIILLSFLSIVIPVLPLLNDTMPVYISWIGDYGSLLNRTYMANEFLIGSFGGAIVLCLTPWLSRKITSIRNGKILPFQGVALTLFLLILIGTILQMVTS
ncbi:hypothetical protein HYW75_01585 [Candidatus Pacearchaeota archaeon]|nr:hypothetical protein [Candidatus Pacearchaeota archaeon]